MKCAVLCLLLAVPAVLALNNGLAITPQMGWNSWNFFACNVNETILRETADAIVSSGLAAAGYKYVNVDDCWAGSRDAQGNIHPNPVTFPSGMQALATYMHDQGLFFGLYSDAGEKTCAGCPGSLNYEKNDAFSYASWGVDYLKYDNCYNDNIPPEKRYPIMRDALNATGRQIFFSMCEWGVDNPATWAPAVGNSWRTTGDIKANWDSIMNNLDLNDLVFNYSAPGGWNDPDMLEVGNPGLSEVESKSHFSLWALVKAPLLIGCDVRSISDEVLNILTAPEVIAVSQDQLGVQGNRRSSVNNLEVWAGPLYDGSVAAVLLNRGNVSASITAEFSTIGLSTNQAHIRDLWQREDLGVFDNSFTAQVDSHASVMIKVTPISRSQ